MKSNIAFTASTNLPLFLSLSCSITVSQVNYSDSRLFAAWQVIENANARRRNVKSKFDTASIPSIIAFVLIFLFTCQNTFARRDINED